MHRKGGVMAGCLVALGIAVGSPAQAGLWDSIRGIFGGSGDEAQPEEAAPAQPSGALTQQEITRAVLDALSVGVRRAVDGLSEKGGYLNDAQVRIPMPQELTQVEGLLRRFGQDEYADRFVTSMNRAAEQAVGTATPIFLDAIKNMSIDEARQIVQGPDDAATRYFERNTRDELATAMQPIVGEAIDQTRVTSYYQTLVERVRRFDIGVVDTRNLGVDLEQYVTDRALDGLFIKLAAEEQRIRADPVARTTDILKRVFGTLGGSR